MDLFIHHRECLGTRFFSLLHSTRLQKRTRRGLSKTCKFWTVPFVWLCQTLYSETQFKTSVIRLVLLTFRLSDYWFDSLFDRTPSTKPFFNPKSIFSSKSIFDSTSMMVGGKNKNKLDRSRSHLNRIRKWISKRKAKLTKSVNTPNILQEAAGVQSVRTVWVVESDINLEHDPQFRHRVEWRREKNWTIFREIL
jgi:hypothetical protein